MASLVDLFSPTFLMFLGILLLVVALIVVYFESRMRDQNHKIASMLSLVSTLAEDVNGIKIGLNHLAMNMSGGTIHKPLEQSKEDSKLIEVSDDEKSDTDSDSVSDDDDEDEADDEKSSIDEYEYTDKTDYLDKVLDDAENNVKVFKLNISNEDDELDFEENNCLEELEDQSSDAESISSKKSKLSSSFVKNILSLQYDETSDNDDEKKNDYEKKNDDEQEIIISSSDLKTININLEDSQQENVDYKKLQLPRLRGIVVEKGITSTLDATKLKKPELLKLLGVE